ncbi:MAG: hypothetical protein JWL76_2240 [Thermoleophilia bacterium]|nr:hypothetical protein [Thermoleophilia bacterium]
MCTVLVRLDPDGAWPVLVAFVRDEDRDRPTSPPGAWWPQHPTFLGGRDELAGGTWLAVDTASPPALTLLTDQFDPAATMPDPTLSPTRGTLPLLALDRGVHFDLEADAPGDVHAYQSFHLVSVTPDAGGWHVQRWGWDGTALDHEELAPGDHVVASRAVTLTGERERRQRLLDALSRLDAVDPDPALPTDAAWGAWLDLLDGRDVAPDDLDQLTVCSVRQRPGFGTVGASLVGFSADGRIRYDVNRTASIDPTEWTVVSPRTSGASVSP